MWSTALLQQALNKRPLPVLIQLVLVYFTPASHPGSTPSPLEHRGSLADSIVGRGWSTEICTAMMEPELCFEGKHDSKSWVGGCAECAEREWCVQRWKRVLCALRLFRMGKESWDRVGIQSTLHISCQRTGVQHYFYDNSVTGKWHDNGRVFRSTIKLVITNIPWIPVVQVKQPILTSPEKAVLGPWGKITAPNMQVYKKKLSQHN